MQTVLSRPTFATAGGETFHPDMSKMGQGQGCGIDRSTVQRIVTRANKSVNQLLAKNSST